jgi:hypothetical protein
MGPTGLTCIRSAPDKLKEQGEYLTEKLNKGAIYGDQSNSLPLTSFFRKTDDRS